MSLQLFFFFNFVVLFCFAFFKLLRVEKFPKKENKTPQKNNFQNYCPITFCESKYIFPSTSHVVCLYKQSEMSFLFFEFCLTFVVLFLPCFLNYLRVEKFQKKGNAARKITFKIIVPSPSVRVYTYFSFLQVEVITYGST